MTAEDDDDFMPFEDYDSMSEEETERLHLSLMNQYNEMIDRMTPYELYCYRRNRRLRLCVDQRKLAKEWPELFLHRLRDTQRRLLAQRIERRTGMQVGRA